MKQKSILAFSLSTISNRMYCVGRDLQRLSTYKKESYVVGTEERDLSCRWYLGTV